MFSGLSVITRFMAVVFIALALIIIMASPLFADGLIPNGGFESGTNNWSVSGSADVSCDAYHYDGSCAARIYGSDGNFTQWVSNVSELYRYEFWGWIYANGTVTGNLEIGFYDAIDGTLKEAPTVLSASNTSGFVQRVAEVRSPIGTTCARVRLAVQGWDTPEWVRFDGIGLAAPAEGCFIATAASGSDDGNVKTLRSFRDGFLKSDATGDNFVNAYYSISPPVAGFIEDNAYLKPIIRSGLIPSVTVSTASLDMTLWQKTALAGGLLIILPGAVLYLNSRRKNTVTFS